MKHQEMYVAIAGENIPYTTNGLVVMRSFIAAGNAVRHQKRLPTYNAAQYLDSADMKNFISALVDIHGGTALDYLRVEGKGRNASTIADLRVAIKVAMKMDSHFEVQVIDAFVGLAEFRLSGGDEFKLLNQAIDRHLPGREGKASNQGCYINIAKVIRRRCDVTKPDNATEQTWNQSLADKHAQAMRYEMQHKLVNLLELGLVRDWEHLKDLVERV